MILFDGVLWLTEFLFFFLSLSIGPFFTLGSASSLANEGSFFEGCVVFARIYLSTFSFRLGSFFYQLVWFVFVHPTVLLFCFLSLFELSASSLANEGSFF